MSITSLATRLAFALFLIVAAFGALPLHAHSAADAAGNEAAAGI